MSCNVDCTPARNRRWTFALFAALAEKLRGVMERRRASAALSRMSDHQLRDIGVSRAEIEGAVNRGRARFDR